ncbi:SpoVR family protein [Heliomicrobium modesticaldum]|uniref:SpoVR family protein n=1 Tax=Heliomicrobium modesticaldum TaxID=35701 RepID=UPI0003040DE3|nr:SpoVR family protein [Heliomicrobium modesticaldum]
MEQGQIRSELDRLSRSIPRLIEIAKNFGLDFYDMRFEVVPADVLYTFGAYGMPTRFSHWSFGKSFHRLKMSYDYNLSRIYELVINASPCYAFLLEGNTPIQNELVAAHVLAHCDFFKNNAAFRGTSRHMVESMASSAERIREYEIRYGREKVEAFLDAAMAIQEHIDPHVHTIKEAMPKEPKVQPDSPFEDLFALDNLLDGGGGVASGSGSGSGRASGSSGSGSGSGFGGSGGSGGMGANSGGSGNSSGRTVSSSKGATAQTAGAKKPADNGRTIGEERKIPERPEKDLLLFIMEHGRFLDDWQRDILTILREEMLYFWPQMRTKIMNEGWASYWHLRIMREMEMEEEDAWEFAKMHAQVIQPSRSAINPYHLGLKIFEDIEKRYGRDRIFEVREVDTDQSFIRNYLTKELVDSADLYLYKKVGNQWQIIEKNWEVIRNELVNRMTNGGLPMLFVEDGDYNRAGELLIRHAYEGVELDIPYLEKTLPYLFTLWGRTVYLETVVDGKRIQFSYSGEKVQRKYL